MSVLVDTSALFALLDEDQHQHTEAVATWRGLLTDRTPLMTHTYVVVEVSALVQTRLGVRAARQLHEGLLPALAVHVVDEGTHDRAVTRWLATEARGLSLVDVTSFVVMDDHAVDAAFAFDRDFDAHGYTRV